MRIATNNTCSCIQIHRSSGVCRDLRWPHEGWLCHLSKQHDLKRWRPSIRDKAVSSVYLTSYTKQQQRNQCFSKLVCMLMQEAALIRCRKQRAMLQWAQSFAFAGMMRNTACKTQQLNFGLGSETSRGSRAAIRWLMSFQVFHGMYPPEANLSQGPI